MRFETRKPRILTSAIEMMIGFLIFVALLGAVYITNRMGSDYPPTGSVEAVIGKSPDYDEVTAAGKDYQEAVKEYDAIYEEELSRQRVIVAAQNRETMRQRTVKTVAVGAVVGILVFVLSYRQAVKSFEITDTDIVFTYVSGKQKKVARADQQLTFQMTRLFTIRYLFIPRLCYNFYYLHGKSKKQDYQNVFLTKDDGMRVAQIMSRSSLD